MMMIDDISVSYSGGLNHKITLFLDQTQSKMNSDPKLDLPEKILIYTKTLPSPESLFVIQNYNFELREILQSKQELLKEMEVQRSKSENELKSLEFAIENTNGETEKIKRLLQEDVENENYWKEQLKQAEEKKLASVREYQIKMAEYRDQLFSSVGVNEETVMMKIDEMSSELELISKDIDEAKTILNETIKKFTTRAYFDEELIKNVRTLSYEVLTENEVERDCEILENEIKKITEQMKSMS